MECAMSVQSVGITADEVRDVLRGVIDPEVGMNIVDLGLVYGVEISANRLHVDLTMTTPACPMGEMILDDAQQALAALVPASVEIELNLVWDPPWSPDKMSEHAREHFGWS
jgi:metal-sulfur cluster biosynthetic enzyme